MGILVALLLIFFTSLVIWRACDGFEIASEYIGRNLSEGVRGGTINAISSSLPELCTTLIAMLLLADQEGFAVGLGTTAGSAIFNQMMIPAACVFAVCGTTIMGIRVLSIDVSTKVLLRDGISLILCECVLILMMNGNSMDWWQGLILIAMYLGYLTYMLASMTRTTPDQAAESVTEHVEEHIEESEAAPGPIARLFFWMSGGPLLDLERFFIGEKQKQQIHTETWNGWPLLLTSGSVIGGACWMLVIACEWLGTGPGNAQNPNYTFLGYQLAGFGMPTMFVAVIFASMATSVPDTVLSVHDARKGKFDDAVANALGSNIFNIGFALGFPLFLFTLINGPIALDAKIARQSSELQLFLLLLTVLGVIACYAGPKKQTATGSRYVELKRGKGLILIGLYGVFMAFILGRSVDADWANAISNTIQRVLSMLPKLG